MNYWKRTITCFSLDVSHTHTHMRAHINTCARTHAHTHTHIHSLSLKQNCTSLHQSNIISLHPVQKSIFLSKPTTLPALHDKMTQQNHLLHASWGTIFILPIYRDSCKLVVFKSSGNSKLWWSNIVNQIQIMIRLLKIMNLTNWTIK